jgi:hypothetical protein
MTHVLDIFLGGNYMETVRKVYRRLPNALKMPKELQSRRVEVILLPLDAAEGKRSGFKSAPSLLTRFAGAWAGGTLAREDQGDYEVREELL